jgi:hypothetical protein
VKALALALPERAMVAVFRHSPLWGIAFRVSNLRQVCESCIFAGLFLSAILEEAGTAARTMEEAKAAASGSFAVMDQCGWAVMRHRKGHKPVPQGWLVRCQVFSLFSVFLFISERSFAREAFIVQLYCMISLC